jgi:hypothetical protein
MPIFYFSRFLSVLIALFLFASPSYAQNCPPLFEFKVIKVLAARGDNINRLLLKYAASFSRLSPASAGIRPQASVLAQPFKVLPESYAGIYDSGVAAKSPSVGAKSVSFFQKIGDWWGIAGQWANNTVASIKDDPAQVAWFGLGFVPFAGGAIDCGKGYISFFSGAEVDLVATEIGCVGMTLDAITVLSLRPETLVATRGVLGTLRAFNQLSRAWRGAITRIAKELLERFLNKAMTASELIDELFKSKFMVRAFVEGGQGTARKLEDLGAEMLESCGIPLPRAKLILQAGTPSPLCGPQAFKFLRLMSVASDAIAQGFGKTVDDAVTSALEWQARYKAKSIDPIDAIQEIENLGKAADKSLVANGVRTPWTTPVGLEYPIIPNLNNIEGTRVIHVLEHSITGNVNKTLINLNPNEMLGFIDETYEKALRGNYQVKRPAHNSSVICIDLSSNTNAISNILQFIKPNQLQNLDTDVGRPPTGLLIVFSNFNNQNAAFPIKPSVISAYPVDFATNTTRC